MVRRGVGAAGCLAILGLVLGGCGGAVPTASRGGGSAPAPSAPRAMRIVGRTRATFVGNPPPGVELSYIAMPALRAGFAVGSGLMAGEGAFVLQTSDGGQTFRQLFYAPQDVVGLAAPTAAEALVLESDAVTTGAWTTTLQAVARGAGAARTVWRAKDLQAASLSFPTERDGFVAATPMRGMAPASPPRVYATSDGGAHWTSRPTPCPVSAAPLVDFLDDRSGWLLCADEPGAGNEPKALYRTTDGGATWSELASTAAAGTVGSLTMAGYANSLFFENGEVGYMTLARQGVLATSNGGVTWHPVFQDVVPPGDAAAAVSFLPDGAGWLIGGQGVPLLWRTADDGQTWHQTYPRPAPQGPVSLLSGRDAVSFSTSPARRLIQSTDRGATWALGPPLPFAAQSLQAVAPRDLVAADGTRAEASGDFGRHWRQVSLPQGWTAQDVGFAAPGRGFVVADGPTGVADVLRCGAGTCTRLRTPFAPSLAQAAGPRDGIAVGSDARGRGAVFTTSDGGRTWHEQILPALFRLAEGGPAVMGVGARGRLRWLYGESGILASDDGGVTWRQIRWSQEIVGFAFAGPEQGMAVTYGASGTTCWWTRDGGRTFHWSH